MFKLHLPAADIKRPLLVPARAAGALPVSCDLQHNCGQHRSDTDSRRLLLGRFRGERVLLRCSCLDTAPSSGGNSVSFRQPTKLTLQAASEEDNGMQKAAVLREVQEAMDMGRIDDTGDLELSDGRSVFLKYGSKVPIQTARHLGRRHAGLSYESCRSISRGRNHLHQILVRMFIAVRVGIAGRHVHRSGNGALRRAAKQGPTGSAFLLRPRRGECISPELCLLTAFLLSCLFLL